MHWLASQKVVFFLIFLAIVGPLRVRVLHLNALLIGKLRQVPDEQNQLPAIFLGAVSAAKRWHTCKADAILDDPEQFSVGKILRFRLSKIGWLRVQAFAIHRVAAAVVRMARRTMIGKMLPGFPQIQIRDLRRIVHVAGAVYDICQRIVIF